MKILFLTHNPEVTDPLYNWLVTEGEDVIWFNDKINPQFIIKNSISFTISYNYQFLIKPDIIEILPHKIINLHISLLPWNRGSDPNIWSFIDDTPCGVTIHEVDEGLDTGDILLQKSIVFDKSEETLKSSYIKLHDLIQELFKNNWENLKNQKIGPQKHSFAGTYHSKKDIEIYKDVIDYNLCIDSIKRNISEIACVPPPPPDK